MSHNLRFPRQTDLYEAVPHHNPLANTTTIESETHLI